MSSYLLIIIVNQRQASVTLLILTHHTTVVFLLCSMKQHTTLMFHRTALWHGVNLDGNTHVFLRLCTLKTLLMIRLSVSKQLQAVNRNNSATAGDTEVHRSERDQMG